MRYDAVFFDLDGTVIDSLQDIVDAVNHTMRRFGLPEHTPRQLRPHLGWGVGHLMRAILPEAPEALVERALEHYRPYYAVHAGDKSRPFPGILPALAQLRADGLALAILSNKPDDAVRPLARRYFDGLVSFSEGEREGVRRKPWPDMLASAARRLSVDLGRCLYVGDSEVDIETANNAGIDCLCVTWGFRTREELLRAGAVHIIDAPDQLVPFVEGAIPAAVKGE